MEKIRKYQKIFLLRFLWALFINFPTLEFMRFCASDLLPRAKLPQKHSYTYKDRDSYWIVLEVSDLLFSGKENSVLRILAWEVRAIFLK
jgi:hypothetical protein